MSHTRTVESRPYDSVFDATFAGPLAMQSDARVLSQMSQKTMVAGTSRYKYFRRPVLPRLNAIPPQILLAPTTQDPMLPISEPAEPAVKSVEVQTVYRESEAQTIPYTPNYIIPEGQDPEILLLKGLTYEKGLPMGASELDMIEHARAKRLLESNLPPFTDEAALELRKKLMEKQELKEFYFRESEIDNKRELRLKQLKQALIERDESNEFLAAQRVEAIRQINMENREKQLTKIRTKRIKVLRRLANARLKIDPILTESGKRDIIDDYYDKASELYVPMKREGKELVIDSNLYDINKRTTPFNNLNNILELETSIPKRLLATNEIPEFAPLKTGELFSKTVPSILTGIISNNNSRLSTDRLTSAARRDIRNTKRDIDEMHKILLKKRSDLIQSIQLQQSQTQQSLLGQNNNTKNSRPNTTSASDDKKQSMNATGSSTHNNNSNSNNNNNEQDTARTHEDVIAATTTRTPFSPNTTSNTAHSTLPMSPKTRRSKGRPRTPDLTVDRNGMSFIYTYNYWLIRSFINFYVFLT